VPVPHQRIVHAVVIGQLDRIVTVRVGLGEQLAQVGEARLHRVAHHVQDLRLRQCMRDETDVEEVGRQLVGEAAPRPEPPRDAGEIVRSRRAQVRGARPFDDGAVDDALAVMIGDVPHRAGEVVQLAQSLQVRMAVQQLLQQRGAGTVHADNEYRHRARVVMLLHRRRRGLEPGERAEQVRRLPGVVGKPRTLRLAADHQRLPGLIVTAQVVQFLVQGEAQQRYVFGLAAGTRQLATDRVDMMAVRRLPADPRLQPVALRDLRSTAQCAGNVLSGLVEPAQVGQYLRARQQRRRKVGVGAPGFIQERDGPLRQVDVAQLRGHRDQQRDRHARHRQQAFDARLHSLHLIEGAQPRQQFHQQLRIGHAAARGGQRMLLRGAVMAGQRVDVRQLDLRVGVTGGLGQRLGVCGDGTVEILPRGMPLRGGQHRPHGARSGKRRGHASASRRSRSGCSCVS
jgi:hypothetical protein